MPTPLDPDELLSHSDWLHRLVRGLVLDESQADDVVQETWVKALERPPRERKALPAWLAAVARNTVRQDRRSEQARTRRQGRVAAPPRHETSTAELAARAELHRELVRRVLEMEEPYRSTLLLRYMEGLEPTEIGRRLGTSPGTIRSRVKRGLDQLRADLDAECGGDRGAWIEVLLPLADLPVAATTGAAATASGALLSSLPAKVIAGTGVLALIAVAWFWGGGENGAGDPAPPPPNGEPTVAREGEARPAELLGAGTDTANERRDLVVLVADERGRALSGAVVEAFAHDASPGTRFWSGEEDRPRGEPRTSVRTDAEGRAGIGLLSDDTWLVARAEGRAPKLRHVGALLDVVTSPLRIRLEVGYALEGRVIDTRGRPVAGVLVAAHESRAHSNHEVLRHQPHAVSGPDGSYALTSLAPEMTILSAARPGATLTEVASVRIPEVAHFDVILPPAAILRGTVTHADTDLPLEGVEVRAVVGNGWDAQRQTARAVTNARGAYEITALPPVRLLRVVAEHGDLVQTVSPGAVHRQDVILSAAGRPVVWDIPMRPGVYVEGTVLGPDGPLAEAHVDLEPEDQERAGGAVTTTASDGSFRCGPVLTGTYSVTVMAWGYESGTAIVELRGGEPAVVTLTIAKSEEEGGEETFGAPGREIRIRGIVYTDARTGAGGARVHVRDFHGDPEPAWDVPFAWAVPGGTWTGGDGAFETTLAATAGHVEIRASLAGFAPALPVVVRLRPDRDEYEVKLRLRTGQDVEIAIVNATTGQPVPGATATLRIPTERGGHVDWIDGPPAPAVHAVTGSDGRLVFEHVPMGEYAIDVGALRYVGARRLSEVPTTDVIVVELEPSLVLGGTLAFEDGTGPGVVDLDITAVEGRFRRRAKTDAHSSFHVAGLPAGDYTIEVEQAIRNPVNILEETLGSFPAGRTDLVLRVRRGLTIRGRVVGPDGAGVHHALIKATDEEGYSAGHLAYTSSDGTFEMTGLSTGKVRLEVEATGYLPGSTDSMQPGTRGVVVAIERGGTISGVVVDEDGEPVAGLYVAAVEPDDDGYVDSDSPHARTAEDGTFTIGGITLERVQLAILQNFAKRVLIDVASVPVGARDLRVICSKGATISGQVLDRYGDPLEGAEVLAEPATYGSYYVEVTDKDGKFTITALFPDRDYELEVRWRRPGDEEEQEQSGIPARSGATDVVIRLE